MPLIVVARNPVEEVYSCPEAAAAMKTLVQSSRIPLQERWRAAWPSSPAQIVHTLLLNEYSIILQRRNRKHTLMG